MTLHWKQTRAEWAGAILLAMIAGYLDGYGLLFLGTYVSFMTFLSLQVKDNGSGIPKAHLEKSEFLNKYNLVMAEVARTEGRDSDAAG